MSRTAAPPAGEAKRRTRSRTRGPRDGEEEVTMGAYYPDGGWHDIVDERTHDLAERLGAAIESDSRRACPVDTGRLRSSHYHRASSDGVRVGASVYYAPFVELGHRVVIDGREVGTAAPQPFLRPALYRVRSL